MMLGTWVLMRVEESLADAYYHRRGLWTTGIDPDLNGAGSGTELMGYVPTRWRSLRATFRNWPITSDDVLLDYGSGKGRTVVWAAANYRFRRIIGIELDEQLRVSAEANLARWNGRTLCDEVDFVRADATEYEVPDNVTVIFFGNPFVGAVFEKVIGKVQESLDRNPRELAVLYYHPRMHETLINAGFSLERQQTFPPNDWAVYRYSK
jgi:Histone methylation protein DOT1